MNGYTYSVVLAVFGMMYGCSPHVLPADKDSVPMFREAGGKPAGGPCGIRRTAGAFRR